MRRRIIALAAVVPLALLVTAPMSSAAPGGGLSGAIFTTDVTGLPVTDSTLPEMKKPPDGGFFVAAAGPGKAQPACSAGSFSCWMRW